MVLVPGLFVCSPDDSEARAVSLQIQDAGRQVMEMPSPRTADCQLTVELGALLNAGSGR